MCNQKQESVNYRVLIKQKAYIRYLIATVISRFGDSVDMIAYGWMVYKLTGSTVLMATLLGLNTIPNIILQPIAGVFVDQADNKKIQAICNLGRGCIVGLTALLFLTGGLKTYHLFIFTVMNSTLEAFQMPSSMAMMPLVLDKEYYTYGAACQSTASRIMEMIGMGCAGTIIAVLGIEGALFIDAATFIICGGMIFGIKVKAIEKIKVNLSLKAYTKDLKDGLQYLKKHKVILTLCFFVAALNMFIVPFETLNVAFITDILKSGPELLSITGITFTVGMMLGSAVFPWVTKRIKGKTLFVLMGMTLGCWYLLLVLSSYTSGIWMYMSLGISCLVSGVAVGMINIQASANLMQKIETAYLGRVTGVLTAMAMSAMPIGCFIVGIISAFVSIPIIYTLSGIMIIIIFALQIFNKQLEELI